MITSLCKLINIVEGTAYLRPSYCTELDHTYIMYSLLLISIVELTYQGTFAATGSIILPYMSQNIWNPLAYEMSPDKNTKSYVLLFL